MLRALAALVVVLVLAGLASAQCRSCGPQGCQPAYAPVYQPPFVGQVIVGQGYPFCGCQVTGYCQCLPGRCYCPQAFPSVVPAPAPATVPPPVVYHYRPAPQVTFQFYAPVPTFGGCPGGRCR